MSHVDVLNATYIPLGKTQVNRAVALVMKGDAVVEKADPFNPLRSAEIVIPTPLVIRMLRYIDVPIVYAEALWTKVGVLERDNYTCGYCGKKPKKKTDVNVDHIVPRSKGGQNTWLNTICACIPCNSKKDDMLLEDTDMELLFEPTVVYQHYFKSKNPRRNKKK